MKTSFLLPSNFSYTEFVIPKKNGKVRKICAPNEELKAFQRNKISDLAEMFNRYVHVWGMQEIFHGFLKNRNCITAAQRHIGYDVTLMMDISEFFDSVKIHKFIKSLRGFIVLPSYISDMFTQDETPRLAQGFPTSPIIANIYLARPIKEIKQLLEVASIDFALTVYADDIQLSMNNVNYEELASIKKAITDIMAKYDLEIHPHKTRIRWAKHGYRRMLGVMVGATDLKPTRKLLKKMRAARHQKNGPSLGGLTTASRLLLPKALREQ